MSDPRPPADDRPAAGEQAAADASPAGVSPVGASPAADIPPPGPLTREQARALIDRAAELLAAGELRDAADHYRRVVRYDDPNRTAPALPGPGEALYPLPQAPPAGAEGVAGPKQPETRTAVTGSLPPSSSTSARSRWASTTGCGR